MTRAATTLLLIPAHGTLERRLLVDVLAKMARVWLDSQHQEPWNELKVPVHRGLDHRPESNKKGAYNVPSHADPRS